MQHRFVSRLEKCITPNSDNTHQRFNAKSKTAFGANSLASLVFFIEGSVGACKTPHQLLKL